MVPLLLRKEARGGGRVATSYCFVSFGHEKRALRSPFGNLRPITPATMWCPALAGRGGSVSRRDHNQAAGNHTPTRSGILYGRKTTRTAATLRMRGSGGEALLLEKRPLPQLLPTARLFGRKREGGVFSIRKVPSLAISLVSPFIFSLRFWGGAGIMGEC